MSQVLAMMMTPRSTRLPLLLVLLAMLAVSVGGCATGAGGPGLHRAPHDVYESLYVGAVALKGMAQSVNELRATGVINADQHRKALDEIQKAITAGKAANVAFKFGNIAGAQDGLGKVEASLRVISALLLSYGAQSP